MERLVNMMNNAVELRMELCVFMLRTEKYALVNIILLPLKTIVSEVSILSASLSRTIIQEYIIFNRKHHIL